MNISVKFFAFRELTGTSEDVLDLPAGSTVADLAGRLAEQYPALFPRAENALYLVNQRIGTEGTGLNDGDIVILGQLLGGG